jgi:hypothetical protein
MLRLDDPDRERSTGDFVKAIERDLLWLGLSGTGDARHRARAALWSSPRAPVDWQAALHVDLLAPTVRALLGRDLLTHYFPQSIVDLSRWDRALALEDALSDGWHRRLPARDSLRRLWFSDLASRSGTWAPNLVR